MKKNANILECEEIDIEEVSLSFQSEERRKVYYFLMLIFPDRVTLTELSRGVLSDRGNVLGALKGDGV